jgi:hypothetical protein
MRTFTLHGGLLLGDDGTVLTRIHAERQCNGRWCVIHRPSPHHMRTWPLLWRDDRGIFERVCPHRVGHPDPDQTEYLRVRGSSGVHGCDGCCTRKETT